MEIKLTLNGRPLTDQIDPGLLLIDFLRDHGCFSVNAAARLPTAACAPFSWTALLFSPVPCWPPVPQDTRFRLWRGSRKRLRTLRDLLPIRERINAVSAIPDLS